MDKTFVAFVFIASLLTWALGVYSDRVKAHVAPPLLIVLVGTVFGALTGEPRSLLLRYLDPLAWAAVGFGVTSLVLRFDAARLRRVWRTGTVVTVVAMLGMWVASSFLVWLLFDTSVALAMVIGGIVAPTDPVVASSILSGPLAQANVPPRIRNVMSFESSVNDGLAFLFVFVPLLVLKGGHEWGGALAKVLMWQALFAAIIGAAGGWIAGSLFKAAVAHDAMKGRQALLASLMLTMIVLASTRALDLDSVWASFAASVVFTILLPGDRRNIVDTYQAGGAYLTMVPALLVLGMALPWSTWADYGAAGVALAVLVLLLRRLPVVALLYFSLRKRTLPDSVERERYPFSRPADLLFYGWFGPIGTSSTFYAVTAFDQLQEEKVWAVATLVIFASVVAHGLTSGVFVRWYGRTVNRDR